MHHTMNSQLTGPSHTVLLPATLLIVTATLLLCACSGGYSFTGASVPPNAKTISVTNFPNFASTINPQLSHTFSDELRNMFQSQTSLAITNEEGDLQVSGEITGYDTRASALSSNDEVSTNRFTITVKVHFENAMDPGANFDQQFSRYRDYNAQLDFSSVESQLVTEIVKDLCEDIFNKAVVNW